MPRPSALNAGGRRTAWLIAALAVVTGALGLLAALAPVTADDPVVSWPRAGQQPTSTVLTLSPYRPLQLTATIPCATLRALDGRPGGGEALRTLPADVGTTPGEGLVVAATQGTVTITASGAGVVREPLPAGDCTYRILADAGGVQVARDGAGVGNRPELLVPQVAELQTDATLTRGLSVRLHTDARYQSQPTLLKAVLLIAHGLGLALLLGVAWRWWRGAGESLVRPRLSWADAVVVAVSLAWVALGPVNIDDSWYLLMARNAMDSGYIGNVIYQFNVTENPFSASQYLMQAWGALGGNWSLGWMRLLPVGYGLVTYALLRVLVATVLGRAARPRLVPWAVAAAHLVWFLAYGITLRPEPLIALGSAVVLVLAELARRRRSVGVLAVAVTTAALTVTTSPTGLVAAAPLVLCLPWLWQWWQEADAAHRVGSVLLVGAAASVVIPVAFGDATLGDVREAVAVHRWYYRQNSWYEEYLHYANLLVGDERGAWGKRLPVLLTLAVLLAVLIGVGRRAGTGGRSGRLLGQAAAVTALGLGIMALTPTKWVNHFGAVSAPATLLLATAMIRSPLPRRAGTPALLLGTAGLVTAAAVAFAGPNLWRPFSDWGQPFGDHLLVNTPYLKSLLAPSLGPLALRNPVLWLAVAALGWWWARRRGWVGPDRTVLITASGVGVALMVAVFTVAPLREYPGTSVALMNLRALTGRPCGLAPAVRVITDVTPGLGSPVGPAGMSDDMRDTPLPEPMPEPVSAVSGSPQGTVWHDDVPGGTGTGSVTTPWYPLPPISSSPPGAARWVLVPLRGNLSAGQHITVELGSGDPAAPDQVHTVRVPPAGEFAQWTTRAVALPAADVAGPSTVRVVTRPSAVRVVAQDLVAGPDSWLALGQPRLATARPVTDLTAGRPVFADQVSAALWACQDQITVANGLAQPPALRLRAGGGLEGSITINSTFAPNGGTLLQVDRTATFVELPSQLVPPGVPKLGWGHVEQVVYLHPVDQVDLHVEHQRRAGWTRLPTLTGERYTGRAYTG